MTDAEGRPPADVVAAVIRRNGAVLLGLRPEAKRHGLLWEFPGGKVEPGESFAGGVARELREELQVEVLGTGSVLFVTQDPGSEFRIHFLEVEIEGEPRAVEHEAVEWVRLSDLLRRPLAPSDKQFVTRVLCLVAN